MFPHLTIHDADADSVPELLPMDSDDDADVSLVQSTRFLNYEDCRPLTQFSDDFSGDNDVVSVILSIFSIVGRPLELMSLPVSVTPFSPSMCPCLWERSVCLRVSDEVPFLFQLRAHFIYRQTHPSLAAIRSWKLRADEYLIRLGESRFTPEKLGVCADKTSRPSRRAGFCAPTLNLKSVVFQDFDDIVRYLRTTGSPLAEGVFATRYTRFLVVDGRPNGSSNVLFIHKFFTRSSSYFELMVLGLLSAHVLMYTNLVRY